MPDIRRKIEAVVRGRDEMHRRDALKRLVALFASPPAMAQAPSVSTLIGTGSADTRIGSQQPLWPRSDQMGLSTSATSTISAFVALI